MNTVELMNEMVAEASKNMANSEIGYGFSYRETEFGEIECCTTTVNTNSKQNQFKKSWKLNDKRISAAKLAAH